MPTANKPLTALTASDLMSRDLVIIPEDMPLREVARQFTRAQISGAPVVSATGRCVGVLSATDFFRRMDAHDNVRPTDLVRACMTADPVTVSRDTPVHRLARLMLDAHIHRLIVVDRAYRPVGVVSSTDLLAVLAYADADG